MNRHIVLNNSDIQDIQMTPLMKAIKSVHAVSNSGDSLLMEDIKKQRASQDRFSGLVTPSFAIDAESVTIKDIPAEWIRPNFKHNQKHIILYCHGGGYTCGSLKYARVLAGKLAHNTGLAVFSFEYKLAPESPYPAALEDALTVWNYLMQLGYGAKDIVLVGDSAGGNLALELALRIKSKNRIMPKALILMSPWTDMTMSGESYETCKSADPMLTKEYIATCRYSFTGFNRDYMNSDCNPDEQIVFNDKDFDYSKPEYSPLFADYEGFPPILIQVGSNEILKSDSYRLYEKLLNSGVHAVLEEYEDAWHVFQMLPVKKATEALESVSEYIDNLF